MAELSGADYDHEGVRLPNSIRWDELTPAQQGAMLVIGAHSIGGVPPCTTRTVSVRPSVKPGAIGRGRVNARVAEALARLGLVRFGPHLPPHGARSVRGTAAGWALLDSLPAEETS